MEKKSLDKLKEELQDIDDAMDATQVGDEDTLIMLGLGDNWDELTEIRNAKEREIQELNSEVHNPQI